MKAVVQSTYGSTDVLELRNIDKPRVGDHEVPVRVHAAGVHRGDWLVMRGLPYIARSGCAPFFRSRRKRTSLF